METIEALPLATEGYPKWRLGVTLIFSIFLKFKQKEKKMDKWTKGLSGNNNTVVKLSK